MQLIEVARRYEQHGKTYFRSPKTRRLTSTGRTIGTIVQKLLEIPQPDGEDPIGCIDASTMRAKTVAYIQRRLAEDYALARTSVDRYMSIIRCMLTWACSAEQELLPEDIAMRAMLIRPLKPGRSAARETDPVQAVPLEQVETTCLYASEKLRTLVMVQWFTGMRPGEACDLRRSALDTSGRLWTYRVAEHKNSWRQHERVIPIGLNGQRVLTAWMEKVPGELLFEGHRHRTHPTGEPMSAQKYRDLIARICRRHDIPHWHPNQLRHAYAERVAASAERGDRDAQIMLGHTSLKMTRRYLQFDPDMPRKRELAMHFG